MLLRELPEPVQRALGLWTGCVSGALLESDYKGRLEQAGFEQIDIEPTQVYDTDDIRRMAGDLRASVEIPKGLDIEATIEEIGGSVMSAFVRARKPN